jgi:hypothetical protein
MPSVVASGELDRRSLMTDTKSKSETSSGDTQPAPRKVVPVVVVTKQDGSALVEWLDGKTVQRCYIPAKEISPEKKASKETLAAGIPYGVQWEDALSGLPSAKELAKTIAAGLRQRGIWTLKDLDKTRAVQSAIRDGTGNIFSLLRKAAKEETHEAE